MISLHAIFWGPCTQPQLELWLWNISRQYNCTVDMTYCYNYFPSDFVFCTPTRSVLFLSFFLARYYINKNRWLPCAVYLLIFLWLLFSLVSEKKKIILANDSNGKVRENVSLLVLKMFFKKFPSLQINDNDNRKKMAVIVLRRASIWKSIR